MIIFLMICRTAAGTELLLEGFSLSAFDGFGDSVVFSLYLSECFVIVVVIALIGLLTL